MTEEKEEGLTLDKKTIDVLVANIIPTSKYFEVCFDHLQQQIGEKFSYLQQETAMKFQQIDGRFDHLQQETTMRFQQIDVRFDHLEQETAMKFQQVDIRFDHLQQQIDDVKSGVKSLEDKMDKRFTVMQLDMDKRFEQVDKRFEQVDNRFDKIDKRFEQIDVKLDKLIERVDVKIDAGLRENRALTIRLFTFALGFAAISMVGLLGKMLEIF